jgi:hypothetical protein
MILSGEGLFSFCSVENASFAGRFALLPEIQERDGSREYLNPKTSNTWAIVFSERYREWLINKRSRSLTETRETSKIQTGDVGSLLMLHNFGDWLEPSSR